MAGGAQEPNASYPYQRRRADYSLGSRVTGLEVEMRALGRAFEKHVETSDRLLAKLDERADNQDIMFARLLAGLAVLMFLGQLAAPVVLRWLDLTI